MQTLDDAQLWQFAPSIFSTAACSEVSSRYGFASTIEIVNRLRALNWHPVRVGQTRVKDPHAAGYARHMLRFRRGSERIEVGDCVVELVLNNSHDKSASLSIRLGLFRQVCGNGLTTSMGDVGSIRLRHGKRIVPAVISELPQLLDQLPVLEHHIERFRAISMSDSQQLEYSTEALQLRYGLQWQERCAISPGRLLRCRRYEDVNHDLWTIYNVVQENLMRGGLRGFSQTGRRVRTRPIRSVTADLNLNVGLWRLTAKHAQQRLAT